MKILKKYSKLLMLLLVFTACEGELVETPTLDTFTVGLKQGNNVETLSENATITNGDTLVFNLNAKGDHIVLNTPFDALTYESENMPVEAEYRFLDDTLQAESKEYQLELVVTNVYDGDNIKRSRETIKLTAQDTNK